MTKHYGNDELLAHAYLPDENAELTLHLASCEVCEQRLRNLLDGLQRHASRFDEKEMSDTFWKRQELGVMRAIDERRHRMHGIGARIAAAAAVIFVVAAFWAGRGSVKPAPDTPAIAVATATQSTNPAQDNGLATSQITTDPWQSEQLEDFQTVVAWETWTDDDKTTRGTT